MKNKRAIFDIIIITAFLSGAFLIYIFSAYTELPFIYNQF